MNTRQPTQHAVRSPGGSIRALVAVFALITVVGCGNDASSALAKRGLKADSVIVSDGSPFARIFGGGPMSIKLRPDGNSGGYSLGALQPTGPVKVWVFRKVSSEMEKKWAVRPGAAYIQRDEDTFEYIGNVSLRLSDQEIARRFGVIQ